MLLYTEHEEKIVSQLRNYSQSFVCLEYIIPKCLSSVVFQKIEVLRISIMEMRTGLNTKPSLGYKIHAADVDQFYKNDEDSKMSLNNQLDIFYENCLLSTVENEVVYIFHAPLLTTDDFFIFQNKFVQTQNSSWKVLDRYNREKYTNTLAELASLDDDDVRVKSDWTRI